MSIDALNIWVSTFEALQNAGASEWAPSFASWVDSRVSAKTELPGIGGGGLSFTFDKATFSTQLEAIPKASDSTPKFADAWETAILSTIVAVANGSYIGTPSPTTTWSVVASTVIDPASIAAGKSKLLELEALPPAHDSQFPKIMREAFLLLTITTSGTDSDSPSNPLVDPSRGIA